MHISKVHTVSVLQAGDDFRPVLDFQVCLHDFYVHDLALGRAVAFGAETVKLKVAPVIEWPYIGRLKWVNVPRLNVFPAEKGPESPEL